ncbi:response regulator [candidate division KSB1 bacterium]
MDEKKILVVDDEESIRELYQSILGEKGYIVETAESGEQALELLEKQNVQVMYLDLNLPGMDGLELARQIRKLKPIAILYAFTGYSSVFELLNCREAGFDDYFKKPMNIETVLESAEDAFKKIDRWSRR